MAKSKRPRRRSMAEVDAAVDATLKAISPESVAEFSESVVASANEPMDKVYSVSPNRMMAKGALPVGNGPKPSDS